ncbi:membrane-bound lytic murein transglycosylase MltF [Algicola sagamiensis]|uniref:membrane-bound lytic murein transglycosylase MltF n=1 Tax=Algicola sagamiensis TaxID=163869 RepID=UPI00037C3789|nr:membrane-bound lytic murein transglycosylase MltF [Algicola sagamiensis]
MKYQHAFRFIITGILGACLWGCEKSPEVSHIEKIKKANKIRVGTVIGPTAYYIGTDGPTGFEFELAQSFSEYLDVDLEVVPKYSLDELFPLLEQGQVDFLASSLTVTKNREAEYRFSPPYLFVSEKLIYKKGGERPRNFSEVMGTIEVIAGSSHHELIEQQKVFYPEIKYFARPDVTSEEIMSEIIEGEVEYTIVDSTNLAINRRFYPDLSVAFTVQSKQPIAWMLPKSNDDSLISFLVDFFGERYMDGFIEKLKEKYFGHVQRFDYVDTHVFIRAVADKLPKYEAWFKQYAQELDWRLIAAQAYQESHWEPHARSFTGVRGIMMLTKPTAKMMKVVNRLDPEQSIQGGAKYLRQLITRIPERIPYPDKLWFALAAYNVGLGHLEDARVLTERDGANPDNWADVKKRLPLLRHKKYYKTTKFGYARGEEPVHYVENIRRYYDTLVWLDREEEKQSRLQEQREKLQEELINQEINEAIAKMLEAEKHMVHDLVPDDPHTQEDAQSNTESSVQEGTAPSR